MEDLIELLKAMGAKNIQHDNQHGESSRLIFDFCGRKAIISDGRYNEGEPGLRAKVITTRLRASDKKHD